MISTSDIVILVLASGALAVGIYRWHDNTQDVSAVTIPANSRMLVDTNNAMPEPTLEKKSTLTATNNSAAMEHTPVVVKTLTENEPVNGIVVGETEQTTQSQNLGVHKVRPGDYLGKIAKQYGTDTQTLRNLNGISGSLIHVGEEILYPL